MASCKVEDCVTMTDDILVSIDSFLAYSQHPNVLSLRTWVGNAWGDCSLSDYSYLFLQPAY